jgi:hypothetical protein
LNDIARKLVVKQIKAKATTLDLLRQIYSAIGSGAFLLILDDLDGKSSAALVKRLDKENPELHTATLIWLCKRLAGLASGASAAAAKPAKAKLVAKKEPKGKQTTSSPEQKELAKALKAIRAEDLAKVRDLWREHGAADFTLMLGGLTEIQTKDLAKKLDRDNRDIATGTAAALRDRISDLASGRAEPVFRNIIKPKSIMASGRRRYE